VSLKSYFDASLRGEDAAEQLEGAARLRPAPGNPRRAITGPRHRRRRIRRL
jgi:hypothetical protein